MSKTSEFDAIPSAMRAREQWVVWRRELRNPSESEGPSNRQTKIPYIAEEVLNGKMRKASSNKPETWTTLDRALAALAADASLSGIGYCFSNEDGLVGIDLDHCFDGNHVLFPWAKEIVGEFAGTYIETSPSGDGLHIWCLGKAIKTGRRVIRKEDGVEQAVEVYDWQSPRYFTVTGKVYKEENQ